MRRNATREIVQVNFETHTGQTWAVFGNHWPSRSGGQSESAGYRHIAAETLAFHQRVLEVHGPDNPVLVMGDFNDEPFDVSLVTHALSTHQQQRVVNADTPRLWNLMWPAAGTPNGSFYVADQGAISYSLARYRGLAIPAWNSLAPVRLRRPSLATVSQVYGTQSAQVASHPPSARQEQSSPVLEVG
jgi:hypothetical protein